MDRIGPVGLATLLARRPWGRLRGVIVVVGRLDRHAGVAARAVAAATVAGGARTELVGAVPADAGGDVVLAEIAAAGIGHAAVLRSPSAGIDRNDLDLALRYLPDIRVIVLVVSAEDADGLVATATDAAAWSGARLIVAAGASPESLPADAVVLEAPASDPDGAFAGVVADLAVRLDAGAAPITAWEATRSALALEPVAESAATATAPAVRAEASPGPVRRSGRRSPAG